MIDIEICDEGYFDIDVAGLASFVIRAADEDFAFLKLRDYCKNNPFLNIDPDAHFDAFNMIKPVPTEEVPFYKKSQISQNIVRLMAYTEDSSTRRLTRVTDSAISNYVGQLALFPE
jgi:hypothetical protein